MKQLIPDEVIRLAQEEVGYHEKATNADLDSKTGNSGSGNWTKYARDLWVANFFNGNKNGYDWCATFFAWLIYQATGHESTRAQEALYYTGPYGASCTYASRYYKTAGAWFIEPKVGDQIFFGSGTSVNHTGLVVAVDDERVYTIEGNADNAVRQRSYKLTDSCIIGYGRPKYDEVKPFPFVDATPGSWYYDAAKWCYEHGIVAGTDSTHLSPNRACSRAEVMEMIYKACR